MGRAGQAATDWKMNAELLSYSRNKGLFAGISLDGTSVSQNRDDTETYYGAPQHFENVLKGNVGVPSAGCRVCSRLWRSTSQQPRHQLRPEQHLTLSEAALNAGRLCIFWRLPLRSRPRPNRMS